MAGFCYGKLEESGKNNARQVMMEKEMEEQKGQEQTMQEEWNALSHKIKVKDMPEQSWYNRLHLESKHVQNIIKMIYKMAT
jgi:hypothetical protein